MNIAMDVQQIPPSTISFNALRDRVHSALRSWEKVTSTSDDLLSDLLLFQEVQRAEPHAQAASMPRLTTNHLLRTALDKLVQQNEDHARLLQLRFIDGQSLRMASRQMKWTIDQVRHRQRDAIDQLAMILAHDESHLRELRIQEIESTLTPPTYSQLFGFSEAQQVLTEQLLDPERAWVVAITGIGGIGKTALADAVTRQVVRNFRFEQYVWMRVDPSSLDSGRLDFDQAIDLFANMLAQHIAPEVAGNVPAAERLVRVRQVLKETPHLVVIDNIETVSNTAYLLRQLQDWANPSKFLLTTRVRPMGEASIFAYSVNELNRDDATALMRHHACSIGQQDLANATAEQAQIVHEAVGGNPLAIKLVVSLATTMPISLILDDLTMAHTSEVDSMYARIYQRAWHAITESQRVLLQSMPLIAETGGSLKQLKAISGLSDNQLWPAINELVNRSLLELRGTTWDQRYGIHRLTASFLQTNINRWDEMLIEEEEEDVELLL